MDTQLLLKGLLLGFSIAAPVGPIGVLCIRRTAAEGQGTGWVSGLGAATADALYGCIAAFGLTLISNLILGLRFWISLVGGCFLIYLGIKTYLTKPAEVATRSSGGGLWGAYLSTLVLTLTNPMTILSFAAIFAGLGIASQPNGAGGSGEPTGFAGYAGAATLVLGVFVGSALWWFFLSGAVSLFRGRLGPRFLRWLNRISGLVLLGFGVWALASLFRGLPQ